MAKKHKKRKKLTRRLRRQQSGGPEAGSKAIPVKHPAEQAEPEPQPEPAAPEPAAEETAEESLPKVTATFRQTASRGPDGIDQALAATEYPAVRRDLRKLGLTIVFFAAVTAGLAVFNAQTNLVGVLGQDLFRLWQ
jgi:hypothetical protein